jgi:hypothetical protein
VAGKRDQASHEAAIARIAEVLPYAKAIRAHLSDILYSAVFKGSRRSQEFLTHVVECALASQWERLKERSLGIEVFSRDACYDTGGDSIVRVTASDVRRRLLQYYAECDQTPAFRIEIPAGSYIPEFPGLDESGSGLAAAEFNGAVLNGPGRVGSFDVRPAVPDRVPKAAVLVLLIGLGWVLGMLSARLIASSSEKADSRYGFYRELLGPIATDSAHETEIALSNPRLLLYVGSNNPAAPSWPSMLNARVPAELEKKLNPSANDVQANYPFHFLTLADQDYTGVGEAVSAFNLSQLMRHIDRAPRLTQARFLNWGAARNVHLILLGAPDLSSWVQESLGRSNFVMEHDAITNVQPLPGERKAYYRSLNGNGFEDYGLIWMARLPSGLRRLLIAGLTSAGTAGVGDFFCDPDRMRPVYERLRSASGSGSVPADWQVLLHIHVRENVPLEVSFVSLRAEGMER